MNKINLDKTLLMVRGFDAETAQQISVAVNSHEELLAAAKIGLSYMKPQEQTIYGSDKKFVEATIAKAEEKL